MVVVSANQNSAAGFAVAMYSKHVVYFGYAHLLSVWSCFGGGVSRQPMTGRLATTLATQRLRERHCCHETLVGRTCGTCDTSGTLPMSARRGVSMLYMRRCGRCGLELTPPPPPPPAVAAVAAVAAVVAAGTLSAP